MKVIVTVEHRFDRTPDGAVWTQTMFAHSYWMRYFDVFEEVVPVARVREVSAVPSDWIRADGERVSFVAVPYYIGPWQYLLKAPQVQHAARQAVVANANDAVIFYAPSQIAYCIEPVLRASDRPYGVYVIADPYDVFAPGSVKSLLRPFLRWQSPRRLREHCANANVAAYITEKALQLRYPPNPEAFKTYYSMAQLPEATCASVGRSPQPPGSPLTLIAVGSLAQLYKAPDAAIEAVAICMREGLDIKLIWVGDGKYRAEMEALVGALGLAERVFFRGQLTAGDAVRTELDRADLFIMPSHQEGLPRAMVEAMARALPCIGSTVGGIPELLDHEDLVPPGNAAALASKIREVVTDRDRMARMSARNLNKAKEYTDEVLRSKRNAFYRCVREQTEAWIDRKS
ncbi:glycosyltransferase family 4 protein [Microcoleus sp. A006_D1]|uniref:glycosyltransferase family 4 protein n=1 Tax=Microcoleus sp. A006_D1 TaxID=3055267 RepID=UPI002FD38B6D